MAYIRKTIGVYPSIEKNIPIPKPNKIHTLSGILVHYPWKNMEVTDSFAIKIDFERVFCAIKGQRLSNPNRRYSIRKLPNGIIRVWRIK